MLIHDRQSPGALRPRRGFTILEFLVVFTMLGVVGGAVTMLLMRQQRFYTNTSALTESRAQIRQALNVMPLDLWSVSSVGGDIYAMTDSSIEFRAITGASIVCISKEKDSWISVPPLKLAKGPLTAWVNKPTTADSMLVYDDSTSSATARDDHWNKYGITAVDSVVGDVSTGCPASSTYAQLADLVTGNPSYVFTVSPKQTKTILSGAPVRLFRRVRYSLFKDTDAKWYLGYTECLPNQTPACAAVRAVSGPFLKYNPAGASEKSGLTFTYYDSMGVETTNRLAVARINVVVRGAPEFAMAVSEFVSKDFQDSLRFDIALRNRK
jgi:type II secretory pathway pseudopilin PulG